MIKTYAADQMPRNGLANTLPAYRTGTRNLKSFPEDTLESIKSAVSKHPATALASGFILGGLLAWLLTRSK
jgi:hypothetical protein